MPGVRIADDLLDRQFAAQAPNRYWVADITYLRTWEGWLYLVAVQDLHSRRIVGWSMADHMRTELVTDAPVALAHRHPDSGLIWHSDQGSQFCRWRWASNPAAPASPNRWAHGATASTAPSPRASSRHSRRSSSTAAAGRRRPSCAPRRVHRGLLQPPAPPQHARATIARGLRERHPEPDQTDRRRFAAHFQRSDQVHCPNSDLCRLSDPCPPKRGNFIRAVCLIAPQARGSTSVSMPEPP